MLYSCTHVAPLGVKGLTDVYHYSTNALGTTCTQLAVNGLYNKIVKITYHHVTLMVALRTEH